MSDSASFDEYTRMRARRAFLREYALRKGWPTNADDLTWEQIMEIRAQPEWHAPEILTPERS